MNGSTSASPCCDLIASSDGTAELIGATDQICEVAAGTALFIAVSDRRLGLRANPQVRMPGDDRAMPALERAIDRASERSRRAVVDMGREIHAARLTHGLSQASVAGSVGIAQSQLSEIERGRYLRASIETLGRLCAVVGLDLSIRAFPGGQPLRDRAHIELLDRFRRAVGPGWAWTSEAPLPIPGDKRAWDRVLKGAGLRIGVEGETRPTDMQDLGRRLALKKRDGGVQRLILVLADTTWCRRLVRLNDLDAAFPVPGKVALRALAEGRDPGGDAIVLI
jgi:transcriptional regulator with XRE-family HTH domain